MTREDLEREVGILGWKLKTVSDLHGTTEIVFVWRESPCMFGWFRLGALDLILAAGLKHFRQRDVYKHLTGETKEW